MATVELDIIKQQSKKLLPHQKRELIRYLAEGLEPKKNGEILGWWNGREITKEEYLRLEHNEQIDFDLARAYANNHEDED